MLVCDAALGGRHFFERFDSRREARLDAGGRVAMDDALGRGLSTFLATVRSSVSACSTLPASTAPSTFLHSV